MSNNTHNIHLLEFVAQKRFHQRIVLPATGNHGRLTVTYADIGPRTTKDGSPTPTMLLIQGMAGSRLWCCHKDHLANKLEVRMISIDRYSLSLSLSSRMKADILDPALAVQLRFPLDSESKYGWRQCQRCWNIYPLSTSSLYPTVLALSTS